MRAVVDSPSASYGVASAAVLGRKLGRYLLVDKLGGGGMGLVMKALDIRMDREVAIKILSPKLADNRKLLVRFRREVRVAAKLDHQNIITAYDADDVEARIFCHAIRRRHGSENACSHQWSSELRERDEM